MIKKNLKNTFIGIVGITFISILGIYGYKNFTNNIYYSDANYIADFDDNQKVSGFADNIFVGEVIENLGEAKGESGLPVPNTNFNIKVLYNIKGNIKGEIIITQEAGYDSLGNLYVMEGCKILEVGNIYLISTQGDKYTLMSHPNGSHLLSSDINKSKSDIKKLIKENNKIKEFRDAYKNEVYYQDDYKISTEKNAYKKLTIKEKEDFENIDYGFVE